MSDTRDTHAVDYVAEIARLKADVENRDKAIERMRRESISMRIAANLDRIEAALGLPTNQPIAIEMILGRIEKMAADLDRLQAENAELVASNDRLRQDRYDALSVTSRDGLLSSEWVMRTGIAERKAKEAQSALARVTAQRDYFIRMVAEAVPVEIPALLHPHGLRIESGEVKEIET